ncbi:hypothetical protein CN941_18720 [Bacillus cereus]|uniref:hypothetical protein n=1 Tax=Bacillus nitratireducens TaxID=2026193 RepID=UPI0001A100A6|nr:hypothetical protein [Bacillus nitratireducens]EEL85887.1 hypothetical protein bcere0029_43440 [Bacillus cereus AH1272]EEL91640.1 hypothetical protein bcere0030_43340 [Bacillus cereus AH1273]EJQ15705.1 hypothetical protein IE3_00953 [Bacillus cereus BAG3X2-1]EOP50145.1 hypothetical protein IKQ_04183 [Bacillus cereus VDM053]PEA18574.1 hypothetical protein CON40_23700 [Bacillus cereus]
MAGIIFFLVVVCIIIVHVLTHRRMNGIKKKLYFVSLILASIGSFIPISGENEPDFLYFGVPAETFVYYGGWEVWFNPLGFFFNFILFYWVLKLLLKIWEGFSWKTKK